MKLSMMPSAEVNGKRFTIWLVIGFVVFTLVMTFGTWGLGELMRTRSKSKLSLDAFKAIEQREKR